QRQLPTDHDYAVSTREYQTDQSSLKPAPAAAGPVLEQRQKQRQQQNQPHRCAAVDRVTPYQGGVARRQYLFAGSIAPHLSSTKERQAGSPVSLVGGPKPPQRHPLLSRIFSRSSGVIRSQTSALTRRNLERPGLGPWPPQLPNRIRHRTSSPRACQKL